MKKVIPIFLFSLLWSLAVLPQKKGGPKIINIKPTTPKTKKPPPPPPAKSWFIAYEVTIKGEGSEKDNPGPGGETTWSIDRKYTGVAELNFWSPGYLPSDTSVEKIMAALKTGKITNWSHMTAATAGDYTLDAMTLPIHVVIKDKLKTLVKERGEGASFENTTTETEWKADCDVRTINDVRLQIIKGLPSYNVWINIKPTSSFQEKENVTESTTTSYNRSAFGYGDLPTSQTIREPDKMMHTSDFRIPELKTLLEDGIIHPFQDMLLKEEDGGYEFDSGDNEPEEPIFSGIPETKTKVKVHVYYRFTNKLPKK